ncbi:2OG-Fe(II) oxygenase [Pseudoalteromonas sp. OOF1S-7]|uniref:2OG-Fe(II) oxygenase n=1 Tax=Pseudoalteromonas sp. OOF1S-7 TaxID=2917757 RepID=UPI001EF65E3A|nr:2OG-Fe(II) oxygenase [Pseudoalteromonas sp. OOF1S-7]MCG7533951.1 2OG-Fe(II) oxygenase [Pseudoalteromonas sp. OOF1S-7]
MAALVHFRARHDDSTTDDTLFSLIADDLLSQGYSIRPGALPCDLADDLLAYQHSLSTQKYEHAGIGRGDDFLHNDFVRTDEICWINGESEPGQRWLDWTRRLQQFLNRRLFMGLFSFESHFAHYASGSYYKRHYDAFRGETNRILSLVTYLNPGWAHNDGGEMVLYRDDHDLDGIKVVPLHGTLALFLSEEFPHEVLPAKRDRYSIAGWFRVNTSIAGKIDPPR